MRLLTMLCLLLLCAPAFAQQTDPPTIKDDLDAANYALGYRLGDDLAVYQLELRAEILWQGLVDSLGQTDPPQLSKEEMQAIIARLEEELQKRQEEAKKAEKAAAAPAPGGFRLPGQEFLAWNAKQPGVKVLAGNLQYLVLKEGSGEVPQAGDRVMVNYKAMNIDGKEFDSSYPLGIPTPVEFNVDKLMPGLSQVLKMMPVGSTWRVFIPTSLAYRDSGPMAGQTVIYDLELLEILPRFQ